MPQPRNLFAEEKVTAVLEEHGVEAVERRPGGVVIWGTRELGKDFPVRFLAAKQFAPGVWDIYTIRNLVEELELDEEVCDRIDNALTGYQAIGE